MHDDGVDALVLRLGGGLAAVRVDGDELVAGGGATNAVCLHRARDAGLGGLEFASAIPGTVGGGVRMNAGAYGGDFREVLVDALVVDADGARRMRSTSSTSRTATPALAADQVVAQVRFRLEASSPEAVKARSRSSCAAQGDAADEQADVRQRLQEPGRARPGRGG